MKHWKVVTKNSRKGHSKVKYLAGGDTVQLNIYNKAQITLKCWQEVTWYSTILEERLQYSKMLAGMDKV